MKYFILDTLLVVFYFKVTCILRTPVLQKKSDATEILDLGNVRVHHTQHEGTADDNDVVHDACLVAAEWLKTCLRLPCHRTMQATSGTDKGWADKQGGADNKTMYSCQQ